MKKNYYEALDRIDSICSKFEFKNELKESEELREQIQNFTLKIMFTGGFSAGKSSAINTFLGESVLTENQTPETAIACELLFDTEDYYEAIKGNQSTRFEISESKCISPTYYDYVIRHIHNDKVRELEGVTIVDMPGFNSGVSEHNKAILRYAGRGNAYVLTIDCEEGEIKQSLADFLEEIKNYDNNIAILVTKADKKDEMALIEIVNNIKDSAESVFLRPVPIETVSKYIDGSAEKIERIFDGFDKEDIFRQSFSASIYELGDRCIHGLYSMKQALNLNDDEINDEIERRKDNKVKLEEQFENEKKKLSQKMHNRVRPEIINEVQNALFMQADALTNSLISGSGNFTTLVNNILRTVLVSSTKKYVEQSFDEFANSLDLSVFNLSEFDNPININTEEIGAKFNSAKNVINHLANDSRVHSDIYKVITTTLAVTTEVVAPWLELILVFLPDVIQLVSSIIAKSQEEKAREQALIQTKTKVTNEIIPQILAKLEPEIDNSLDEMQGNMIDEINESFAKRIDMEIECLNDAKSKLEENKHEYEVKVAEIDEAAGMLENVIENL